MRPLSRALSLLIASAALVTGPPTVVLAASPSAPTSPAVADAPALSCARPTLVTFIDPARGTPMAPHVDAWWHDLAAPAQARIDWGSGEYGMAAIDTQQGPNHALAVDPLYADPGAKTLTFTVTDACGATHVDTRTISVPLSTAPAPVIACPGIVDRSGFCVLDLGSAASLEVTGVPTPPEGWTWRTDVAVPGIDAEAVSPSVHPSPVEPGAFRIQALAASADGWVVTVPLTVVTVAPPPAAITQFTTPRTATAGEAVELSFQVPPAAVAGVPRITIDGEPALEGSTASVVLTAGSHTIAFSVTYPDGSVIQRQTIVVARAAPISLALLGAAVVGSLLAVTGLLLILRRRRRRPTVVTRPAVVAQRPAFVMQPILRAHARIDVAPIDSVARTERASVAPAIASAAAVSSLLPVLLPLQVARPRPSSRVRPQLRWTAITALGGIAVGAVAGALLVDRRSH